jgi:hypothetical protein
MDGMGGVGIEGTLWGDTERDVHRISAITYESPSHEDLEKREKEME